MNTPKTPTRGLSAAFVPLLIVLLAACAARPAPGIDGRWMPVNRYLAETQEIPLRTGYAFHAMPMDRTLKGMLERWARDRRMELDYGHPSDFTLHAPVAQLRTDDLQAALARLNAVYAPQQVGITAEGGRILVRRTGAEATP